MDTWVGQPAKRGLFSVRSEEGGAAGASEPRRRTCSAAAPHNIPAPAASLLPEWGLCELRRATVNGAASDMNLSLAAGWVGDKATGRGSEYLMHPATTQQFALKSLFPI